GVSEGRSRSVTASLYLEGFGACGGFRAGGRRVSGGRPRGERRGVDAAQSAELAEASAHDQVGAGEICGGLRAQQCEDRGRLRAPAFDRGDERLGAAFEDDLEEGA